MKKITSIQELNTESILNLGRENDYALCPITNDCGDVVIQDEDSLSQLLADIGLMFLANDEYNMYYSLNDIFISIPVEPIKYDEDIEDVYMDFDCLGLVDGTDSIREPYSNEEKILVEIRNENLSKRISSIIENFLHENKVILSNQKIEVIKEGIKDYVKDIFKKENNHESLKKTVAFASEIIDILEDVLADEDIYIQSDERTGDPSETCIYGSVYYNLEDAVSNYLDCYITK